MKDIILGLATFVLGVWLFVLLIRLFVPAPHEPFSQIDSCCWVRDQFGGRHYIGPDFRTIIGIPIVEEHQSKFTSSHTVTGTDSVLVQRESDGTLSVIKLPQEVKVMSVPIVEEK